MSDTNSQAGGNTPSTVAAQPAAVAADSAAGTPAGTPSTEPAAASSTPAATPQQGTEGQPAGDKPAAGTEGDGTKADDKPAGAPEKYEFKPPEGKEFSAPIIEAYSAVAKELNLPQDSAQKILDVIAPKVAEQVETNFKEGLARYKADLAEQAKADKEFGGEKLAENLAVAEKALDAFGTPALRTLLKDSGLANHPEMIRAFLKVGKSISEDRFVPGRTQPPTAGKNPAQALYPNQPA